MLRVWVDNRPVGILARRNRKGSVFSYDRGVPAELAVSLVLPTDVLPIVEDHELVTAFDMSLPEGALRERLRLRFAKATGSFEDLDLLAVTGRSQIGRVRLTPEGEGLSEAVPFQSVDEILGARRGGDLYGYLVETFAAHSGIAGVQPKSLFRGEEPGERASSSLRGATHIVKFWEAGEYPELAANEFFCMTAARGAGIEVPDFALSDTGEALVVKRFDRRPDGTYRGFDEFAVINGAGSSRKYDGGYETKVFREPLKYVDPADRNRTSRDLFRIFAMNCALRNGDAHLKNFGLVYDTPSAGVRLAPAYDIVTTCAYLPKDRMALTLNGSTDWPNRKRLLQLAHVRAGLPPAAAGAVLESVADAISDVAAEVRAYFDDCPHPEIGQRMLAAWDDGVRTSLGLDDRHTVTVPSGGPAP